MRVIHGAMYNEIMFITKEYFMDILSNALSDAQGVSSIRVLY